jgi:phage/plasmid-like protein (TIGR03299 family)
MTASTAIRHARFSGSNDLVAQAVSQGYDISKARTVDEMLAIAKLDWTAKMATVRYTPDGYDLRSVEDRKVVYRNDTGANIGLTSDNYKLFQPRQVADFFADLVVRHGFTLDRAGSFKNGRVIFARAKVGEALRIHGNDLVQGEINFVTSFDGSVATVVRFGTKRLICTNGLTVGVDIVPAIRISHRSIVDPAAVKLKLGLTGVYERFQEQAEMMADKQVTQRQAIEFFMQVYHDMKAEQMVDAQEKAKDKMDATIARLAQHFIAAPGADLPSAKGTAWGLLNAVTYDVDHGTAFRTRNPENVAYSALLGPGEALKNKARDLALALAA